MVTTIGMGGGGGPMGCRMAAPVIGIVIVLLIVFAVLAIWVLKDFV